MLLTRYFDPAGFRRSAMACRFQGPTLMGLERRLSDFLALYPCSIDELESRMSQCDRVNCPKVKEESVGK